MTRTAGSVEVTTLGARALDEAKANLDRFLVVGLTERFDESFILVRRALGWRLPMYSTRNASRGPRRARPGDRAKALITERDRLDVELYGMRSGSWPRQSSGRAPRFRARSPCFGC